MLIIDNDRNQARANELAATVPPNPFPSPAWHEAAIGETEKRMNDGIEKVVDWSTAKLTSFVLYYHYDMPLYFWAAGLSSAM
jgi:hypothetical protein